MTFVAPEISRHVAGLRKKDAWCPKKAIHCDIDAGIAFGVESDDHASLADRLVVIPRIGDDYEAVGPGRHVPLF